jgi:hypothetical protein
MRMGRWGVGFEDWNGDEEKRMRINLERWR